MESMRWVGVDVHAKESLAAVLDPATGEISTQRISGRPGDAVVEWLATVPQPFRAVYEAGPTGYGLVRRARNQGLDVVVCAPGHILKNATDHIKVDKRDAVRLARLLSAGELRLVRIRSRTRSSCAIWSAAARACESTSHGSGIASASSCSGARSTLPSTPRHGESFIASGCADCSSKTVLQSSSSKMQCMPTTSC